MGSGMNRRNFVRNGLLSSVALATVRSVADGSIEKAASVSAPAAFELEELTVDDLQSGMASGKYSAHSLTRKYLDRIDDIDKRGVAINAVIELNPDALPIAADLDKERKAGRVRGRLHGIPVLIKDNIDTHDRMTTTAGSLALGGSVPLQDSFVAKKLRDAGVVIIGKANLSEWANFRSSHSTSGWSGRGGQTRNPYVLDRNPCGSSSGTGAAIAANLAAIGVGTETDGSVVCPSSACGLVGIKPTLGLINGAGIIPIAHSQDTAGPMARTVADAATLLTAMAGVDPRDPATADAQAHVAKDYTAFLDASGLKGARIGVQARIGNNPIVDTVLEQAIAVLKTQGAEVVDPAPIETAGQLGTNERDVLQYEFKTDLNAYLATMPVTVKPRTLADLIAFNAANEDREMPYFGQETFVAAQARGPLTEQAYLDARQVHRADPHQGHRRDDGQVQARRDARALGRHRVTRRPRGGRGGWGRRRQLAVPRGLGIPAHHGTGGFPLWPAPRRPVLWARR